MGANERVTVLEAWRNSDNLWYRIKLTLNTGRTPQPEYNATPGTGLNTLYTFTAATGQEFTGIGLNGASSGC